MRFLTFTITSMLVATSVVAVHASPAADVATEEATPSRVLDVTVFADASLTIPLTKIARRYSSTKQLSVSAVFSSSKEQVERIEDGEEAHLFISAKPSWIKRLQQQGLIDVYSRTNIASNQLVIAGPDPKNAESSAPVSPARLPYLLPFGTPDFQFAVGDPEYLAEGTYGFQALNNTGLNVELEPYYIIMRSPFDLSRATSKYDAYSAILKTEAMLHPDIHVLKYFPEGSHDPITYQAVVVAGENMDGARKFLSYLQSDEALEILTNYGFGLVE